jgi:hypothetical protein
MLDAIKSFFNRRIVRAEQGLQPAETPSGPAPIRLAACALLLELAYADEEFSPAERTHSRPHWGATLASTRPPLES